MGMAQVFVISDTHFGHDNILNFVLPNGERMRPFASVEEMDEVMVDRWNAVVSPQAHVYHLGDFAIKKADIAIAKRLNGKKRLVRGNHDIYPTKVYLEAGFQEIYGVRVFDDMILSHIPLHQESIKPRWLANVHGHLHNNQPQGHLGPRYYNVCVEMINYTPMPLETLRGILRTQHEAWQERQAALEHGVFV